MPGGVALVGGGEERGLSWHFYTVHRSGLVTLGRSIRGK